MKAKYLILGLSVMALPFLFSNKCYAESSGIDKYWYEVDYDKDGRIDETSPRQDNDNFNITQNGIYHFFISDVAGNISERYSYEVKNIDNDVPECEVSYISPEEYKRSQTVTFHVSDNMCLRTLTVKNSSGTVVKSFDFTTAYTEEELNACEPHEKDEMVAISENGTYTYELVDYANNSISGVFAISNIDRDNASSTTPVPSTVWVKRDTIDITLTDAYGSLDKLEYNGNEYKFVEVGELYSKQVVDSVDSDYGKETIKVIEMSPSQTFAKEENEMFARPKRTEQIKLRCIFVKNGDYTINVYDTAGNKSEITFTVDHIDRVKPTIDGINTFKVPSKEKVDVEIIAHDD